MTLQSKVFARSIAVCFGLALILSGTAEGGELEPPGVPAPTMKSLDEIEVRTPIRAEDLPLTIVESGSYYLLGNLSTTGSGIVIDSDNVSIDLMGFSFSGASGECIGTTPWVSNVTVKNGIVENCGTTGVNLNAATSTRVIGVSSRANGLHGIRVGPGSVVLHCAAESNGGTGITARGGSVVSQSTANSNTGTGLSVYEGSVAHGCSASSNGIDGMQCSESRIHNSVTWGNTGDGIETKGDCYVADNSCDGNNGAGIRVTITDNRIDSNNLTDNGIGISVNQVANLIVRNTVSGSSPNFQINGGNAVGEILDPMGGAITTSNPWANFEF